MVYPLSLQALPVAYETAYVWKEHASSMTVSGSHRHSTDHSGVLTAGAFGAYVVRYINQLEGLAYLMSDGMLGVVYDDDSRMLAMPSLGYMCYLLSTDSNEAAAQAAAAAQPATSQVHQQAGRLSCSGAHEDSSFHPSSSSGSVGAAGRDPCDLSMGLNAAGSVSQRTDVVGHMGILDMGKAGLLIPLGWPHTVGEGSVLTSHISSSSSLAGSSGSSGLPEGVLEKVALMQRFMKCLLQQQQDAELVSCAMNLSVSCRSHFEV